MYDKLLVPIDFSTCSALVAGQAGELARVHGASVLLLHVAQSPSGLRRDLRIADDRGQATTVADYLLQEAQDAMPAYAAAAAAHGVEVESRVELGEVVEVIRRVADEASADLIVMGTHGRKGLARAVLGSVAERTLRTADVPVLIVRRKPRPECSHDACDWCPHGRVTDGELAVSAELEG